MENPIEMDDLGGTPIFGNTHIERMIVIRIETVYIFVIVYNNITFIVLIFNFICLSMDCSLFPPI